MRGYLVILLEKWGPLNMFKKKSCVFGFIIKIGLKEVPKGAVPAD